MCVLESWTGFWRREGCSTVVAIAGGLRMKGELEGILTEVEG
jgi:hypothetical protein